MKPTKALFVSFKSQALFFAVLLASISVYAQDRSTSILADPRMVVIPARSPDEIAADIDNAAAGKQIALNRKAQADNRLKEIENSIRDREMSRKDIEARMNDAKKGKRESELISLQIESKASQQAIDLLKRLKDLRRAEIEEAEVEAEYAESEIRVLQLENELQDKRTEYSSQATNGVGDLALTTARQVLSELEARLLKLQQEQAGATQKLASKQRDVINQRMKLHQAKLKLGMPRK